MDLPVFQYHPDPIRTGALKNSCAVCECCGEARGFVYTSRIHSRKKVNSLCPWCIADGSAARRLDGLFVDPCPLTKAGVAKHIVDEVSRRTPGFNSWQQEEWLSCCKDACEFHGDLPEPELKVMCVETFTRAFHGCRPADSEFEDFKKHYRPGGNPAIYKWVCRHCRSVQYYADFT